MGFCSEVSCLVIGDPIAGAVVVRADGLDNPSEIQLCIFTLIGTRPSDRRKEDTIAYCRAVNCAAEYVVERGAEHQVEKKVRDLFYEMLQREKTNVIRFLLSQGWRTVPGSLSSLPRRVPQGNEKDFSIQSLSVRATFGAPLLVSQAKLAQI